VLVAVLLAGIPGCGPGDRASVSGKVTLDGHAVEDGVISFVGGKGGSDSAWSKIQDGSYAIAAGKGPALGANRVEIRWSRKTGKKLPAVPPAPASEEVAEAVPERYNTKSELKADIKPGANELNYDLKSK